MPGKSKAQAKKAAKKETIESVDHKQNQLKLVSKKNAAHAATDQEIEQSLHKNLFELAQHSHAGFEYATKNMARTGKGCVFWLFPDYESSVARGADGAKPPPLQYHSRERAMASEYSPVIEMIEKYDPNNAFVALVAIRTGDRRDSLMKVMIIGVNTQLQMEFSDPKKFTELVYTTPDRKPFGIGDGCEFCSNSLCWKVESRAGAFAKCAGCGCKKYCERACQVMHWKMEHKQHCATDKANLERMVAAVTQSAAKIAESGAAANTNAAATAALAAVAGSSSSSSSATATSTAAAPATATATAAKASVVDAATATALASAALRPIIREGLDDGNVPGTNIPSKITKAVAAKPAGPPPTPATAAAAAAAADAKAAPAK